ncbi:MAG: alpha/beta hydrolase [Pseudomonadota bacterium]
MNRMAFIAAFFLALVSLAPVPVQAQAFGASANRVVTTITWVEEWDPQHQRWVRVDEAHDAATSLSRPARQTARYAFAPREPAAARPLAQYGPFLVMDPRRVVIIGSTGTATLREFDAMVRDFPDLQTLEMVEAPGTTNDIANLELGRRIRAAGLTTYVPRGGSVRSGAVELFLAGTARRIEPGAQFAVHAWLDNYGREPRDFAASDPANRLYLDYYVEMGMSEERARAFYAMTNSVPHASAKWLRAEEMRAWIAPKTAAEFGRARTILSRPNAARTDGSASPQPDQPRLAYANIATMRWAKDVARAPYAFLDSRVALP